MPVTIGGSGPVTGVTSINTTVSDTELGFLDGVTSAIQTQLNSKGKILQVVRATDSTSRSTTSTTFVDVTGMSITITPNKSDSAVLLVASFYAASDSSTDNTQMRFQITDSSNNSISGSSEATLGTLNINGTATRVLAGTLTVIGYATPATTSAVTYKLRFRSIVNTTTTYARNDIQIGQLYAIEVSA